MNLGDPQLELIDPTPNVHSLFLHFDRVFFWTKLASRAVVRWSKRMYSSAGICSYEGRGGLCDIALSEPLLKLRPRKDLIETLLHEMIHAYLFITNMDRDRDGHGPNFQAHMHRINKCAGLNISIYHDFHDEVKLYQTHWWRCNGPCQYQKPYFGIVRKTANRAPGPRDRWFEQHKWSCGGTFIKIKEPEQQGKKDSSKKASTKKPSADITKFITSDKKTTVGDYNCPNKGILKDSNNIPIRTNSNSSHNVVVTKKGVVYNPQPVKVLIFNDAGKTIGDPIDNRKRSNSVGVMETVRNVWANKQLPPASSQVNNNKPTLKSVTSNIINKNRNKHKSDNTHTDSPPSKVKKIDDYFKNAATVLKDLYGQDFNVSMSTDDKIVALPVKELTVKVEQENVVDCPVCSGKVKSCEINRHLDECLNKEVISSLCNDNETVTNLHNIKTENNNLKTEPGVKTEPIIKKNEPIVEGIPSFNGLNKSELNKRIDLVDLTNFESQINSYFTVKTEKSTNPEPKLIPLPTFYDDCINRAKTANQVEKDRRRSVDLTNLNSMNNFNGIKTIKSEPSDNVNPVIDDNEINNAREIANKIKEKKQFKKSDSFTFGSVQPSTSKGLLPEKADQICPCCDKKVDKTIDEHLDDCLAFFDNNTTIPEEGASTSYADLTVIEIDDENDMFDETLTLNATGTKCPCPCCLEMVEQAEMNEHLDNCLS